MKNKCCIIIPAIKKNAVIPDQLVKKLNGVTLIQRAINTAKKIVQTRHIFIVTDSQEISLIAERNKVNFYCKTDLKIQRSDILEELKFFIVKRAIEYPHIILYRANTPLIDERDILDAYRYFCKEKSDILITLKEENHRIWKGENGNIKDIILNEDREKIFIESKAFLIIQAGFLLKNIKEPVILPYFLQDKAIEIQSYQDWWICEKLLQRKRILFRVIGYDKVGMGHIYRSLTLAHEITDHEVMFITDEQSQIAVSKIAGTDYPVEVVKKNENIIDCIIALKPNLVVNDMLNTKKEYIFQLQNHKIKTVNFEDLGTGAKYADLTINELYDTPGIKGSNIKWGYRYFFVRDEFHDAKPHWFKNKVDSLLITFGGTDARNLTQKVVNSVAGFCENNNIKIYIVTGSGYLHKESLRLYLQKLSYKNIEYLDATGVISKIMEKAPIAISSNGRTVYELAHMNIPAIIISHHQRENTHHFSNKKHGFINLGIYNEKYSDKLILKEFIKLVEDTPYRKLLFNRMKQFNFSKNKTKSVKLIHNLLLKPPTNGRNYR